MKEKYQMRYDSSLVGSFDCFIISFAVKADWFPMRTRQDDETAFLWLVASLNARRHPQVDEVQQHPFQRQTGSSDTHNSPTTTDSSEWDKSTNRHRVDGNRGRAQEWRIYRTIQKISMLVTEGQEVFRLPDLFKEETYQRKINVFKLKMYF